MLKHNDGKSSHTIRNILLVCALPFITWNPAAATTNPPPQAPQVTRTVYLPVVARPPGVPEFVINSPTSGQTIAGTSFFSVQAINISSVSSVQFKAGAVSLGSDTTAADGFKILLNAGQFAAGALTLTAVAIGPGGTATQTVAVTVQPNPPTSTTVTAQGALVASEIGSIVNVPPGGAAPGTTLRVTERTQAQVTADNKIDWDALKVTFLGAQRLTSSNPISQPLNVSSAGFGNRVQPGQAVVNYMIAPDADGDGVDELVVVNTASVAPNNFVVSDPIPKLNVTSLSLRTKVGGVQTLSAERMRQSAEAPEALSGVPGSFISIQANGFNPASTRGNLAIFESLVNSEKFSMPGLVEGDGTTQQFRTVIPPLVPGAARLTLRNESTGATAGPYDIVVLAAQPLSKPSPTLIRGFMSDAISYFQAITSTTPDVVAARDDAVTRLTQARAELDVVIAAGISITDLVYLDRAATAILGLPNYTVPVGNEGEGVNDFESSFSDALNALWGLAGVVGGAAALATLAATAPAWVSGRPSGISEVSPPHIPV